MNLKSLGQYLPSLISEWHPTKNGEKSPFDVSYGSDFEAYWKCTNCNFVWKVRVANRTIHKTGCPNCNKRWNHSFPELALLYYIKQIFSDAILDFEIEHDRFKGVDIFIPSIHTVIEYDGYFYHRKQLDRDREKTRLLLEQGYYVIRIREGKLKDLGIIHSELQVYLYHRNGEPSVNKCIKDVLLLLCNIQNIDKFGQQLIYKFKEKVNIIKDTIPILGQLLPVVQENNLLEMYPELEKEWHFEKNQPFLPQHFKAKSNYSVWWKCDKGHEYDTKIISRTKGHGCRFCEGSEVTHDNSLLTLYPSIAKEWHYQKNGMITPDKIHGRSNKKVYWICPNCNSSYDKIVNERTGGRENCPYCAGKRVNNTNSLATLRPDLAKEWHQTKNDKKPDEVSTGSHYYATWNCDRGHTYQAYVYERSGGRGCGICYEEIGRFKPHKVSIEKSIITKKPYLLAQWDFEKNTVIPEEVGAYARQFIWWRCSNGCSWQQEPNSRNSSRCKICRVKD